MIPRIIYTTWVSDQPLPEKFEPLLETWREKMPDYEIVVLGMDNIPHNAWVDAAIANRQFILAGHYARCQRIYETGGIYFDVDVEAVRSFDDLLGDAMFIGFEADDVLNNAVFGAEAGHPLLAECMAYMDAFPLDHPDAALETGPRMFTALMRARGWKPKRRSHVVGDIHVYEPAYFYPYLYNEAFTTECIKPQTHAIHHWAYSWNPHLKEPVAIVIPCYNQAQFLSEAIDSALAQTVPVAEIIVVDDCSTDGDVAAVVKPYGKRVKLIRRAVNGGVGAARNTGIAASSGTWIATLDADDTLAPTFVEKTIGRDDIVSTTLRTFGAQSLEWRPPKKRPVLADFVAHNQINCCSLFRREIWEKTGGYDESMRDGYEDWDFWTRACHAGYRATCVFEPLFFYRKHPANRADVPGTVDRARVHDGEIRAYLHEKWARLGIPVRPAPVRSSRPLVYPVKLAVGCELDGRAYPAGTLVDHVTAVRLKESGQLTDPRIR